MALLVTLFLVLVNIFNTVTTNTPKAEGLTAIEAWMLACILFVFGTLTEYACLLFVRGMTEEGQDDDDEEEDEEQDKGGNYDRWGNLLRREAHFSLLAQASIHLPPPIPLLSDISLHHHHSLLIAGPTLAERNFGPSRRRR